ncbi:MAG: iron-containing alcohol dehydrogenase [Christensenellales bacterium]
MLNFEYLLPTRVIFGKGTHLDAGNVVKRCGASRVLFHYGGGSIRRNGVYDAVTDSMQRAGVDFIGLGGVRPNPRLSLVYEGIRLCRKERIDFILAVGGGSVIDSAKAIGMGAAHPERDVWDFYSGAAPERTLPVGVVLTIPAAGSETSMSSVITREEDHLKRACNDEIIRPVFAIMNPELTYTLPAYQTACGAVDIMAHVMERYFTITDHVETTDRLCEAVLLSMIANVPRALRQPNDYHSRAEIMWCGSVAHSNFLGVGRVHDWATHQMEHEISALYDLAHGAGLAILFPAWMRYVYRAGVERFAQFAARVWGVPESGDRDAMAREGIDRLESFFSSIGMPTRLSHAGIADSRIEEMARNTFCNNGDRTGTFVPLTLEDKLAIFRAAV